MNDRPSFIDGLIAGAFFGASVKIIHRLIQPEPWLPTWAQLLVVVAALVFVVAFSWPYFRRPRRVQLGARDNHQP